MNKHLLDERKIQERDKRNKKRKQKKKRFLHRISFIKKKRSCNNEIARSAYRSSQALVYELETFISFDFKKKSKIKMRT